MFLEWTKRRVCGRQEAAALLQQEPAGRGGEMLRAADGPPGGDPRRDHPAALQAAGQQAVGAVTQPAAVGRPTAAGGTDSTRRTLGWCERTATRALFSRQESRTARKHT